MYCRLRTDFVDVEVKFNRFFVLYFYFQWTRDEELPDRDRVWQKAIEFYKNFDSAEKLTKAESIQLTKKFFLVSISENVEVKNFKASLKPVTCNSTKTPTNFNLKQMDQLSKSTCVMRGNGNKTVSAGC